ncbi:RHS repeat-associated core domain-containing protein [Mesorhizobium abyssinicae]|uniref:RHS repeat-associated core domain-containing protein n=2 Tax=Mesorhizobium TaxID=68287 RepID=UPI003399ED56
MLHYVHDLDRNVIAEYDGAGALLREYVWLEDRPVAAIAAGTTPVTYWVHTDHLERPARISDAVVWRAKYLPYGEVYSITGPASLDYRLPGQWFQLESGLNYNWHRHYDPTTGRYLQPDPLGMPDGPSRWAYVGNSPLMSVDWEGLASCTYSISTHTLYCIPNAGGDPKALGPKGVFSGVGSCQNDPGCIGYNDLGPVVPGKYKNEQG